MSVKFTVTRLEAERGILVSQTQCRWLEELVRKPVESCRAAPGVRTEGTAEVRYKTPGSSR